MSKQDRIQQLQDELVAARAEITLLNLKLGMIDDLVESSVKARTMRANFFLERFENQQKELARLRRPAEFYLKMQDLILQSDLLQEEWHRFLSFLKLSYDDIPGYTSLETPKPF